MFPILVPPPKPARFEPVRSPWRGIVRALGMIGFLLFLMLAAMVVTENRVPLPLPALELAVAGFGAYLLARRFELVGGVLLVACIVLAAIWSPPTLDTWRVWFLSLEGFLGLVGVLLAILSRAHS